MILVATLIPLPRGNFRTMLTAILQKAAQLSSLKFPSPSELSLDPAKRPIKNYLGYATTERGTPSLESKQLMLLGLAGMLKYLATLKDLRVAHDRLGRLKMAKTPRGVESYMTVTWDELVPFPTSKFTKSYTTSGSINFEAERS